MERVKVHLLDKNNEVQYGLNWGQRDGREPNQAYLQLTPEVYRSDFFPVKKHYFLVEADDNISFVMNRGQKGEDGSALETPEDNSLLGRYLRKRLGIPEGEKIEKSAIDAYGRSDIDFIKIDTNRYKLDFSVQNINTEPLFREFLKSESKSDGTIRQYISDIKKFSEGCLLENAISKKIFSIIDLSEYAEERKRLENSKYYQEHAISRQTDYPTSGLNIKSALNHYGMFIQSDFFKKNFVKERSNSTLTPSQIIYYGVPGSGKSHKIDEETKALSDEQKMRVVFHPEYTNADFVGQILPVIEEGSGVRYAFKPGAFTKILIEALKNPSKPYYLIIEEINRGNAAAIFGEIFQLLDRGNDGWSSYCIMNDDINYEIRKSVPELNWTENTGIRLPPNLSLLATMNTSDQNVFTLDNAFQRRWDMQLVKNECTDENQMEATITVKDQKITWKDFQQTINSVIGEKSNEGGLSSMEDKRLGCWFVKAEDKEIKADVFANKVLKYLWDDAFKFYHQEIFGAEIKNFEELQKSFFEKGFAVFSDACGLKIEKTSDGHAEVDSASESIDSESSSE